ncbi:Fic/DOC family N-terminal domain-containing protein [Rothia nasimurium]|uniref:Fic/DOC family N-terminal domain-containing protein n=1 Tax=Rothia nasimurium TaxID=85336 RepID=UPI001FD7281A|nr:Fic/DOC family N-terminal domain-containing protein [Rothia nasimurium]
MTWSADEPYNDLPPLPPADYVETIRVLKAVIEARAAIAGLNEALVSLPNPGIFLHSLALLEAQASSEIENIVTTTDELFKAATVSMDASGATREALRYQKASSLGLKQCGNVRALSLLILPGKSVAPSAILILGSDTGTACIPATQQLAVASIPRPRALK